MSQSSDARLKRDVEEVDLNACQQIFDAVNPKSYRRVDYECDKRRCGFLAQDVQAVLPTSFQNIVTTYKHGEEKTEMLSLDYSRMAAVVLWGVVKNQQKQLQELTARVASLESK